MIDVFEDTQNRIAEDPTLQAQLLSSQAASQLYLENYVSPIRRINGRGIVDIVEGTTLQCARELYSRFSKVAVLNFANPHEPGGGVWCGAMAQEECLCRCSDLYNILSQPYFLEHYYQYQYEQCDDFFSDRLIYSPAVTIFKSDDSIPELLEKPFFVDVITCAAPYLNGYEGKTDDVLIGLYMSRIRNILEVSMSKEVSCLILGAFGCGAFHNDPRLMANAFSGLLIQEEYARFFEKVVFAIKRTEDPCRNLRAFEEAFASATARDSYADEGS